MEDLQDGISCIPELADLAVVENLVDRHVHEISALQGQVAALNDTLRRLREGHNELQGELEMVSDASCK